MNNPLINPIPPSANEQKVSFVLKTHLKEPNFPPLSVIKPRMVLTKDMYSIPMCMYECGFNVQIEMQVRGTKKWFVI